MPYFLMFTTYCCFFIDLSTYILKVLRVWHWGPSYRFSIQSHVLGGDAHVPPFRHGGLQTAVENTHLKHDITKNIYSIINNEIHYNFSTMNSCKIKFLRFLQWGPENWVEHWQKFGLLQYPPFWHGGLQSAEK